MNEASSDLIWELVLLGQRDAAFECRQTTVVSREQLRRPDRVQRVRLRLGILYLLGELERPTRVRDRGLCVAPVLQEGGGRGIGPRQLPSRRQLLEHRNRLARRFGRFGRTARTPADVCEPA